MPHFVIDCSYPVTQQRSCEELIHEVFEIANSSGLFEEGEIKVRVQPFKEFTVGGTHDDFIHVFSNIMEGRTTQQKAELSQQMVAKLSALFPEVPNIAMNVREFERDTYCNRSMVQ